MTDEQAFVDRCLGDPDTDLPKLVFADWLEEQGRTKEAWRLQHYLLVYRPAWQQAIAWQGPNNRLLLDEIATWLDGSNTLAVRAPPGRQTGLVRRMRSSESCWETSTRCMEAFTEPRQSGQPGKPCCLHDLACPDCSGTHINAAARPTKKQSLSWRIATQRSHAGQSMTGWSTSFHRTPPSRPFPCFSLPDLDTISTPLDPLANVNP